VEGDVEGGEEKRLQTPKEENKTKTSMFAVSPSNHQWHSRFSYSSGHVGRTSD
jgi:hypothetical protein